MSVPNQTPYNIYTANGLTTVFTYEFYIISASDLQVSINGNAVTSGYTVAGVGNKDGGDITFLTPPANGAVVMLERVVPTFRLTDYQDNGDLLADTVNKDFDRIWMAIQRAFIDLGFALTRPFFGGPFNAKGYRIENLSDPVNDQDAATKKFVIDNGKTNLSRTLRVPEASVNVLPSAEGRAWKGLGFDGAGQPKLQDPAGTGLWGYVPAIGSFEKGSLLTQRFEVLLWESTDEYWRWDGVMPKVVLPGSTPATAGGTGKGKWIDVTDATLRANLGSSEMPGTSLVAHSDDQTVEQHINTLNRRTSFVMPEDFTGTDTQQLLAAISYAKTSGIGRIELIAGKTYVLTGTTGLDIDLGYFSFGCIFGCATIDATDFAGDAAVWVHSSAPYLEGNRIHSNKLRGIEVKGTNRGTGQAGIIIGNKNNNTNGTYNGDCHIEDCSFETFDKVLLATNSTWRYKFINCGFTNEMTGGTHIMHFPAGLADSGESVSFVNCKIYDTKRALLAVDCANFAIGMPGTSVLNCPIEINGAGALVILDSAANIENPGATAWYRYAKVTGVAARLVMNGCTLVCNQPALQTKPIFEVAPNAFIDYSHVKSPGNNYPFQNGAEGFRTFVEGDGYVIAEGCIADIGSGAGNIPIHKSLNPTRNFGFATGDLTSWSFNNQGSASQTCVVDAAYKKTGSFGARMKSIGSLSCFLTQNVKVTKHNYYTCSLLVKVVTPGTGVSAGGLTVTFYDRSGVKIIDGISSNIPNTVSGWISIGQFIQGRVVQSAEYCEVSIRCREGAVIDVDSFIINFT
ncbi:TPA: phage tail fiber protein [Klebsiella pneumoniae]|uniref:phage tail fiber domain-containing protein n=1 Tax=Klebsiella pneumoniae TaxID=573 RepID=UPI000E2AD3E2|nr:phage tail fiber protein [Klebsiella pneumoniae]SYT60915.1 endo-N-acetylneuraminidase [Klebsiella pneumoniae]